LKKSILPALGFLCALSLASCSSGDTNEENVSGAESGGRETIAPAALDEVPPDGSMSKDGLVKKDIKTGVLPTDPYRIVDVRIRDYAIDIAIDKCMKEEGLSYPVTVFDWNDPSAPQFNLPGISGLLTVEKAETYGYHYPPNEYRKRLRESSTQRNELLQDPAWTSTHDACYEKVFSEEPFVGEDEVASDLAPNIDGVAELPELRDAAAKWTECMAPLGIADLPETPMIADSVAQKFGLYTPDEAEGMVADNVDSEEIEIAVADAKCRASSGYEQLQYDAYWNGAEEIIAKNSAEYSARLEAISAQNQKYKDYIQNADR